MKKKEDLEGHSINLPRPFGVDYVPRKRRKSADRKGKVFVGTIDEIPPGKARAVVLNNFRVAVFNLDGQFYAIKDACPHAEYPLSKGMVRGETVTCASHNWKFNIKTGLCLHGHDDLQIRTFKVEVIDGEIWLHT